LQDFYKSQKNVQILFDCKLLFLLSSFKKAKKSIDKCKRFYYIVYQRQLRKFFTMAKITIAAKIEQEDKREIDQLAKEQMRTTSNMIEVLIRKGLKAIRQEKQKSV